MTVPLRIRPLAAQDAPALLAITAPVVRAGETYALPPDMSEAAMCAYWRAADKESVVAEADGRVLGLAYVRANQPGGGAHVANAGFMVAAEAQGRGIARALAAHVLDRARARGFAAMQFNFVVATNTRAVRLWQSLGFVEIGRVPEGFRHPREGLVDVLILHRRL
ncbi:GNAT family N-acetyltransferase [Sphingomonas morindae]|uniref:GNAT family N-acetyltransferase n=1 Tax=Sphingomonas morindae TaxID=1541170 RepID=A0ABY4X6U7_9SPHN|nr:GNAT family N-acetyltransferase [Sphingomonas morindae]USI72617.1 GNAT family N-acetyltransferase [Sphingomonas morindae]